MKSLLSDGSGKSGAGQKNESPEKMKMWSGALLLLIFCSLVFPVGNAVAAGSAARPVQEHAEGVSDPFEKLNRRIQRVNDFADKVILKPVAKGYQNVVPGFMRNSVGNFFGNLEDVGDGVNNLLQGKPVDGIKDFLRVTINTTIGLGGLFDPARKMGLVDHEEDFGQTLAVWGMPPGPYLVLPFFGPANIRDGIARPVDSSVDPLRYLYPVSDRNVLYGVRQIHNRADLIAAESVIFGDRYVFFREAYSQRRTYLVKDGEVEDAFGDDF